MIKVQILKNYKSISKCEFEIPNFSVLTGLNGSGKTHLLEAISKRDISKVFLDGKQLTKIVYIPFNGLNPKITEICDPTTINGIIKNFITQHNAALGRYGRNPNVTGQNLIQVSQNANYKKIAPHVFSKVNKSMLDVTEEDVADNFDISMVAEDDFFTGQFALIFKNYHKLREENNINHYYAEKGHITPKVLSEKEFSAKYGSPPWDFVNSILEEINVPYVVNSPEGTRLESNFNFRLIDKNNGTEISSQDLSTGEKVLMSLALAIYNTSGIINKPEFLLIDEPDAALHPSMSRKMIKVLNENIVIASEIPAIITSHSPTTIISSEGVSIYQMERGNSIPNKISIQNAVEMLSSDIPFLKISNDSRRQVFVESKYDVIYYELITNIFLRIEKLPAEPIYIPARTSNGSNCTDVIDIVSNLYANGNDQIYGIIDWDNSNDSLDRIIIVGNKERYSIENYILDPLLMGILFIREAKIPILDYNLENITSYSEISKLDRSDAQKIVDKTLTDLGLNSPNIVKYTLQNTWSLDICQEFNLIQGHALEELYKKTYPFLRAYQREDSLKTDLIQKVINDFPQFVSSSLYETLRKIV